MQQQTSDIGGAGGAQRTEILAAAARERDEGRHAQACAMLQAWLASHPDDVEAIAWIAHSLIALRREAEAQAALHKAMQIAPGHPAVLRTLARLLLRMGKREEALRASEAAFAQQSGDPETCLVRAAVLGVCGREDEARRLFDALIAQSPGFADAWANRAMQSIRRGDVASAVADALRATQLKPAAASMWATLANAQLKAANAQGAIEALREASRLEPANVQHRALLGETLRASGAIDEALEVLRAAADIAPGNVTVLTNLGVALLQATHVDEGKAVLARAWTLASPSGVLARTRATLAMAERDWVSAIPFLEALTAVEPSAVDGWTMLTRACGALAQASHHATHEEVQALLAKAERAARKALELEPSATHRTLLGGVLMDEGHAAQAAEVFGQLVAAQPGDAEARLHLGLAWSAAGRIEDAVASFREAVRLRPDYARAYSNMALLLLRLGRIEESLEAGDKAVAADPSLVEAQLNRASVLVTLRRLEEAVAGLEKALALKPDFAEAHAEMGNALSNLGDPLGAIASYRRAHELKPGLHEVHTNLLFQIAWSAVGTPQEYLAQARRWEESLRPPVAVAHRERSELRRAPREGRRLRIGYVSGDLRQHAVAKFLEPILRHHDRSRFFIAAYMTTPVFDAVSQRLKSHCDQWTPLLDTASQQAWKRVLDDEIDVLIDLAGFTRHNALPLFARRAAPLQAHYIGYFASTGIRAMDGWIADAQCVPPEFDSQFSEEVWRLPRPWMCYEPSQQAPEVGWKPAPDGSVTLGSFNNLTKFTDRTIATWSRILHQMPQAVLMLKTSELESPTNRARISSEFAAQGVPPERLLLLGKTPGAREHLAMYDRLDVALDPIGAMGGVTTTCDALWMGAPVITLAGDRMSQRASTSLLHGIGHPEWVAQTEDEYVAKTIALARDLALRTRLRAAQRETMRASPLCDGPGIARAIEALYEKMFDAWRGSAPAA